MSNRITGDFHVAGTITSTNIALPSASVGDSQVIAAAGIAASKLEHQHSLSATQAQGTDVVTATTLVHLVTGTTGTIERVNVLPITAPTGGDKEYTVDIQKASGTGSPATVLSSVVTVDSSSVDKTEQAGTISVSSLLDGDWLQVVVTASGSTGSQGQGFLVNVVIREDA